MSFNRLAGGLLAALAIAAAGMLAGLLPVTAQAAENATTAPLFAAQLPDPRGVTHELSSYAGRPLVANFWASWCAPCVQEMPELSALRQAYAGKGINFVGIAIDSPANVVTFLQKVKVTYPIYVAGYGGADLVRALGDSVGGLPFTIVIDSSGRIRYTQLGEIAAPALRQVLDEMAVDDTGQHP